MKKTVLITLIALAGCSTFREVHQGKVHHVVLCWLKDAGNATQRRRIVEASKSFREIPGVLDVRVGQAIESDRKGHKWHGVPYPHVFLVRRVSGHTRMWRIELSNDTHQT